ncbi:MAG: hypothetical protein QNJ69_08640 [Gammaproteobacteria bacterium]|nr:hypothetical protein [Gammaproteobacteria bacterium]
MKISIDWRFLKWPLIFLTFAVGVSAAFIAAGKYYENIQLEQYNKAKSSLRDTHGRYKKLVEDLDLLQIYTQTYDEYRSSGLVGSERRLSWIETLETVNEVLKLPKLSYTLMPQEGFQQPKLKVDRNIQLNSTPMSLDMDMLHEEDLFAVFEGISGTIDNLYTIDSCSISLIGGGNRSLSTQDANLRARCLMRWVTVDVKQK